METESLVEGFQLGIKMETRIAQATVSGSKPAFFNSKPRIPRKIAVSSAYFTAVCTSTWSANSRVVLHFSRIKP